MPEHPIAFLAKRKLHVRRNGVTRQIDSDFERTVRERAASIERRHAWKSQGRGAMFTGAYAPSTNAGATVPVLMTGLAAGPDSSLLYSMETDAISGLFLSDSTGFETRLFHTADLRIRHAALDSAGETIAATAFHSDSLRSNICTLPLRGIDLTEVTEGDSFDQFPQWAPGSRRIVFQSAGIGRDAAGRFAGLGPCAIQQLDLNSGDLDEVAAEPGHDLLQPRMTGDGSLYYIRKPYESGRAAVSLVGSLKDTALFPFRMARAVFQYFNIFSMMYTGKPLTTAKGTVQRRLDPRQMFIHGNLASASAALHAEDESQASVPSTWELVKRGSNGETHVLASSVLAFDIASDGSVVFTDGTSINRRSAEGHSEKLLRSELVERVLAL